MIIAIISKPYQLQIKQCMMKKPGALHRALSIHKTFIHPSWPLSGLKDSYYKILILIPLTQISWISIAFHVDCIFPIILAIMMLFVPRKDHLTILILTTHIILWRCISFYMNAYPSCCYPLDIKTNQTHLLLTKVERRFVLSNGYQEKGSQNGRIVSYR